MLKTNKKRILSFTAVLMIIISVFSSFTVTVSAASWKTGNFDNGYVAKGYTTVKLSNLKKKAYIKIFSYDKTGRKSSGEMHITLRDNKGRWICEFDTKSGNKLKLGNDHSVYRVYIAKKKMKSTSADWINIGKCQYWAINTVDNCYI